MVYLVDMAFFPSTNIEISSKNETHNESMRSALVYNSAVNSMYFVSTKAMIITSGFKYLMSWHYTKIKIIIESNQKMALLLLYVC